MAKSFFKYIILIVFFFPATLRAASIWGGDEDMTGPAPRNFKPGDIITVVITEESSATAAAGTKNQTQNQNSIKIDSSSNSSARNFFQGNLPTADLETESKYDGNGTTTRSGKLSAVITTNVDQVLPNGNLLLRGKRRVRINKETQIIAITGVARPRDISDKNNIASTLLADAEIKYEGKGPIGGTTKPGIINKLFDWLF